MRDERDKLVKQLTAEMKSTADGKVVLKKPAKTKILPSNAAGARTADTTQTEDIALERKEPQEPSSANSPQKQEPSNMKKRKDREDKKRPQLEPPA